MGQPKLTLLAAAIRAAEQLSDEEKQTLRDVLRPAPKPRSKSKAPRCAQDGCGKVTTALIHDTHADEFDHLFKFPPKSKPERKPSQKRKAGKEATAADSAGPRCWSCGEKSDANVHHVKSAPAYHEFIPASAEPAGEASKGVGV